MTLFKAVFASAALVYLASAKTIKITATSDNTFDPDSVEAEKDDVLEFHFETNHSVVAGDYQYPCSPLELGTGFFSGFVDDAEDKVFRVTVNDTEPTAFYSSREDECAKGMVGIVNPSQNETLNDYKERASDLSAGVTPGRVTYGGKLVDSDDADSDDDDDDNKSDNDDDNAAQFLRVPVFGLLGAVSLVFFMT
ncbi:hypothetical protein AK830_g4159 [Neonectria ditissima]|uniref:Phytocyanin domain-containing protein n=1 Tax=Neonectria ditissima TaxID=78410 RepID=A0A0P7AWP1_9HYPO|nr:hypothetical protein AK830_g4159 [Neonectria ditissima]